jgi:hypothetical protein
MRKQALETSGEFTNKNCVLYTSRPKDRLLKRRRRDKWSPLCLLALFQSPLVGHL